MTKEEFWTWFKANKTGIQEFILKEPRNYDIYEELTNTLKEYNELLIPELTMSVNDKFILVISCDGIRDGIPSVQSLTEGIEPIENWEIQKFRQPGPMEFIPVNGHRVKRSSIYIKWKQTTSQKYDITLVINSVPTGGNTDEIAAFLHLDHTIGEYNSMTRIEGIEVKRLGFFQSKKGLKTLDEFKIELDNNPV